MELVVLHHGLGRLHVRHLHESLDRKFINKHKIRQRISATDLLGLGGFPSAVNLEDSYEVESARRASYASEIEALNLIRPTLGDK